MTLVVFQVFLTSLVAWTVSVMDSTSQLPTLLALYAVASLAVGGITTACALILAYRRLQHKTAQALEEAAHDPLTDLLNRRSFQKCADLLMKKRPTATLVAVFLDLNNFKLVNDELGHEAGDEILTLTAQILTEHLGPHGIVGRRSGDEFLALLTAPEEKEPSQWASSLLDQTSVRLRYVHNVSTPKRQPGASIGVHIAIPAHRCTTREMFRRADSAMYEAKKRDTPIYYWSQALEHLDPVAARPQTRLRDEAPLAAPMCGDG
ncbi:MAG: GGDEF domain-containing protein [Pseudonocardiaceae bacterium]